MKQLFLIYSKKFLMDALYLYIIIWPAGFFIKYINAGSEQLYIIFLSIFFCFYSILFFTSYPLESSLKWVLITPISRRSLIIFNITFQLFKIFIIGVLFLIMSVIILAIQFYYYRTIWPSANFEKLSALNIPYDISLRETSVAITIILIILFSLTLIFNISPQMIIKRKKFVNLNKNNILFLIKKYKRMYLLFIPGIVILKLFYPYWSAPLFIGALGISYLIFASLWSYTTHLNFPQKTRRNVIIIGLIFFIMGLSATYFYSNWHLNAATTKASLRVSEIRFQKGFFHNLNRKTLINLLESNISKQDIEILMDNYLSFHSKKAAKKKVRGYVLYDFPLNGLNFNKTIKSKDSIQALMASLGILKIGGLNFSNIEMILARWSDLSKKVVNKRRIIKYANTLYHLINPFPFTKDNLISLLSSKEKISQNIGLKLYYKNPQYQLTPIIIENIKQYDNDTLNLTSKILSKIYSTPITTMNLMEYFYKKKDLPEISADQKGRNKK